MKFDTSTKKYVQYVNNNIEKFRKEDTTAEQTRILKDKGIIK
jgi:hypothetical protein